MKMVIILFLIINTKYILYFSNFDNFYSNFTNLVSFCRALYLLSELVEVLNSFLTEKANFFLENIEYQTFQ